MKCPECNMPLTSDSYINESLILCEDCGVIQAYSIAVTGDSCFNEIDYKKGLPRNLVYAY